MNALVQISGSRLHKAIITLIQDPVMCVCVRACVCVCEDRKRVFSIVESLFDLAILHAY